MSIIVRSIVLGELEANCYIIEGEDKHCVLIDPGDESIRLVKTIQDLGLTVDGVLITHCHFDHIGAASQVAKKFNVEIYAHPSEATKMMNPQDNLSAFYGLNQIKVETNQFIEDGQCIDFGNGLKWTCLEVAGHTENSICFYHEEGHVFTGDTLFNDSIGRTDLYSGSPNDLVMNIKRVLLTLPVQTQVYPGHGLSTTIGKELQYNTFISMT